MALTVTDAVDPGYPQVADGIAPGYGKGTVVAGTTGALKTLKQKILTCTFSGTYATGGYTLTTDAMAGLGALFCCAGSGAGYVLVPTYNANGQLVIKLYWRGADNAVFAEVTNGTAIAFVTRLLVFGREV